MTGRRAILGALLAAITLTACGGGKHFANQARPPVPVNVSVYISEPRLPEASRSDPLLRTVPSRVESDASRAKFLKLTWYGCEASAGAAPASPKATAATVTSSRRVMRAILQSWAQKSRDRYGLAGPM